MRKLYRFILNQPTVISLLIFFLLGYIIPSLLFIPTIIAGNEIRLNNPILPSKRYFEIILIVPIFETFVFQYLAGKILRKFVKNLLILCVLLGILFSVSHWFSLHYLIYTFADGFILAFAFFYYKKRHNEFVSFVLVSLIHIAHNGLAMLV
ncbi:MAG: type II CAAX prenyl endopeptidase Rce1 family protein [Paludibacteraceae bacterium]